MAARATRRRLLLSTKSNHPTSHCRENTFTAWHHWVANFPIFNTNQIWFLWLSYWHEASPSRSESCSAHPLVLHQILITPLPKKNLFSITDCIKTDYVISDKICLLGQLIFQYYILFRFILWIRHTIHRFRFTGLKIFMPPNNIQQYLQNLVIPSMTRLDTLVNGALIVHWPLAGKIHGEHWLRNRHGWERRSILVLF